MYKLIIFFLKFYSLFAQYPKIEDFQVKGFENTNFINVLLDAESDISTFYTITDDGLIYRVKYLENDTSLLRNINFEENWDFIDFERDELLQLNRIKVRDNVLYVCDKIDEVNSIVLFNKSLEIPSFYGLLGPFGNSIIHDFEFHHDFDFNHSDNYQVGRSETEGVGSFFNKFVFEGKEHIKNKTKFPSSSSLNRIISNDFSQYKEFIAVGNNGLVLLIDRGATSVENNYWQNRNDSFSFYPNPTTDYINIEETSQPLVITNMTGKVIRTVIGKSRVDVSDLPAGVYFLQIGDRIEKLVKYSDSEV